MDHAQNICHSISQWVWDSEINGQIMPHKYSLQFVDDFHMVPYNHLLEIDSLLDMCGNSSRQMFIWISLILHHVCLIWRCLLVQYLDIFSRCSVGAFSFPAQGGILIMLIFSYILFYMFGINCYLSFVGKCFFPLSFRVIVASLY